MQFVFLFFQKKTIYQLFFTNSFQNYTFINPPLPLFTSHNLTRMRYRVRKRSLIVFLRVRQGRDSIHPTVFGGLLLALGSGLIPVGLRRQYGVPKIEPRLATCKASTLPPSYCCSNAHLVFFIFLLFPWNKPRIH